MNSDRISGCIVGGAIGDAMGGPHENKPAPVNPYSGGAWHLSDDTQLTLATCEAIQQCGAVDPSSIAATFLRWFEADRISGIGGSTYHALNGLAAGAHWALAGRKGEMSAGNGAAMRIAPLAFFCDPASPADRVIIRDVCRITHHNDEAYCGALAVVLAIQVCLSDRDLPDNALTHRVAEELPDTRVRDQLQAVSELDPRTEIPVVAERFGNSGYVVHTVPLALFAAQQCSFTSFEDIIAGVISAGGDTDTNASVAGQIVGSSCGYSRLPIHLVKRVPTWQNVLDESRRLAEWAQRCADGP